ncbi:hypothetical protein WJX73_002332 [Symbiochloris irregularis]|uniref:Uncharacterized protein n=1 Tax=Symbiochloris irregularis TaxID=706552 RepID=A0AAW1NM26_9CHLO
MPLVGHWRQVVTVVLLLQAGSLFPASAATFRCASADPLTCGLATWERSGPDAARPSTGHSNNSVLVLTLVQDEHSWGTGRSFINYFKLLSASMTAAGSLSLALLVGGKGEFSKLACAVEGIYSQASKGSTGFASGACPASIDSLPQSLQSLLRVTLMQPGSLGGHQMDANLSREERHSFPHQRERRSLLARLRNKLLMTALQDEAAVLWVDADVHGIDDSMLGRMLASGLDIITPNCKWRHWSHGKARYYDYNTWRGPLQTPNDNDRDLMRQGAMFQPKIWWDRLDNVSAGPSFLPAYEHLDFVEVTAVGATVLFVRADVHRQGVIFTPGYVVGADWEREGWDGVESEGICILARMMGFKCHGMPQTIVWHESPPDRPTQTTDKQQGSALQIARIPLDFLREHG